MGRAPCCDKANVKKGPWSPDEDLKLKQFIEKYGTCGNWIALPQKAGLKRCGKSCRLRWLNYLRPNIKHGEFSDHEDKIICTLFATIGSRWSVIAAQLPGRTDNDIKNYWNTKLKKKLMIASSSKMVVPFPHHHHQPLPLLQSLSLHHQTTLSPSPPSTYFFTDSTKPNLELSNPLNNTSIITCPNFPLQVIQESLLVPKTHHHYTPHMMGSDQTSCSNSSDGSSTSNQFSFNGDHYQQMGSIIFEGNYFNNSGLSSNHEDHQHQIIDFGEDYGFSSHDDHERQNGLWGELTSSTSSNHHNHLHNDHYSTIEEIKQLVSSTTNSSNSNNFFMYY